MDRYRLRHILIEIGQNLCMKSYRFSIIKINMSFLEKMRCFLSNRDETARLGFYQIIVNFFIFSKVSLNSLFKGMCKI